MPPEEHLAVETAAPSLIDWEAHARCRTELGSEFLRILGYFREDGLKSVTAIEDAVRGMNAVAIVVPAHTLKGEARQFGAEPLALLAEAIEDAARTCIEHRDTPEGMIAEAAQLGPLFAATLDALEREANPLVERRRARPIAAGQAFGRNEF